MITHNPKLSNSSPQIVPQSRKVCMEPGIKGQILYLIAEVILQKKWEKIL